MISTFLATIASKNTRDTYNRGLRYFEDWMGDSGAEVQTLRVKHIKAFREHLASALAGTSANTYLSALRAFLKWAAEMELVEPAVYQAATVVGNVKTPERLPTVLKTEEVTSLLCLPDPSTLTGARDLAFVALLVSSGMRLAEAVNLDLEDLDIQNRTARVVGKGDKERLVRFDSKAARALAHYLHLREAGKLGPVFVNRWGNRISARYLQERVANYGLQLENGERLHPHTFRHYFATQYLDRTGDLDATRRWLGHSSATTTQVYTKLAVSRLNRQYDDVMEQDEGADALEELILTLPERALTERK